MGVMTYLRERMGKIVAIVIGLSLFAFIVGEVLRQGGAFFKGDNSTIGEVAGEKLDYKEFSRRLDLNTNQFKQQSGQSNITAQFTAYLQENTWNQFISQVIFNKEIDRVGLTVGGDEAQSMVSGKNPNPQIVQAFGDPKTGQLDKTKLNTFLSNLAAAKSDDPQKIQWNDFISQMIDAKKQEKYQNLISNGLYINALDAKDDYDAKNKLVNFKYITLDYASIPDNKVTLTNDDYQSYYNEHKSGFKNNDELRGFDYVSFSASPSKEDSVAIKEQITKLIPNFQASTNDSLFVQVNAETKTPFEFKKKGQIGDPKLDSIMFGAQKGFVYGPYLSNGSYKIAKLSDLKTTFDSVKTRHILIDPNTTGSIAKAIAKADSIKKLIQGGKSFADMAATFSADKGSAAKGGDIPSFDVNGAMGGGAGTITPPYTNAAFKGKKGDLVVVTSQFGVHLIEILDQKGSVREAQIAIVDKPLTASAKTQSAAYSKAQGFLSAVNNSNFIAEAKKENLTVKTAKDVTPLASGLPGLDNAREVVRWAFKADKGDVGSQVYVIGDQYIIPILTSIKPKGISPLDEVKKQIEPAVRNRVKAKQLIDKFTAAENGASNIDQVAQKSGSKVVPVQNVVFANPVIPGLNLEYKVVGTMFGSKPNKLSAPIEGNHGVYVFTVDNFINPAPLTNALREKQQLGQALLQRSQNLVYDALKDKANVKDYRSKFL